MTTTAAQINTTSYRASHGHEPRGAGWWIFEIAAQRGETPTLVDFTGSYSACRKQALAWARKHGCAYISVGA